MAHEVDDLRRLFLQQLGSALFAEETIEMALPQLQESARDQVLAAGFGRHLEQTRQHVRNVQQAIVLLGEHPEPQRSEAIEGLAEEPAEQADGITPSLQDLFYAGAAMRVEHFEIGTYKVLSEMARALREKKIQKLLEQNLEDERETLEELEDIAKRLVLEANR